MTEATLVTVTAEADGVRVLTLNDPDRRNAMSPDLQDALVAAAQSVADDPDARVLVVTGAGVAFSAGADLPAVFGTAAEDDVRDVRARLAAIYDSFLRIRRLPIPTIAAVNGAAVGAGVNLALCCDLRVAGPDATFGITFTRLGLHPGGGCTYFLVEALGRQRAMAIIMGGEVLRAAEARDLGLVLDVVVDPLAAALDRARRWAAVDPALARDVKRAVGTAARGPFEETLDFETWAQAASTRNPLLAEAVARFRPATPS
ncbi:enoyl-CoA hydratase [Jatrophihabitans endophyticus]|uniref:Enoyl-CoA hydratase n=1 Tax=Jatrophihabitans endophyticus TaxID=1206085 RepID=A0A1M5DHU9_9ACTN|nr:enoyl-CoA hydratase-related protein [Jatrophihabitans endophyticus]SHF66540.1 enoyl-CoA hydratase [Jatrophihabitans endophyticus]